MLPAEAASISPGVVNQLDIVVGLTPTSFDGVVDLVSASAKIGVHRIGTFRLLVLGSRSRALLALRQETLRIRALVPAVAGRQSLHVLGVLTAEGTLLRARGGAVVRRHLVGRHDPQEEVQELHRELFLL